MSFSAPSSTEFPPVVCCDVVSEGEQFHGVTEALERHSH